MDEKVQDLIINLQLGLKYISQYSILAGSLFCMEPTVYNISLMVGASQLALDDHWQ